MIRMLTTRRIAPPELRITFLGPGRYRLESDYPYYSPRYQKTKTLKAGLISDGASGPAEDILSASWWVHDALCQDGTWDDGTAITRMQAARVLADILWSEGRWFRAFTWLLATGPITTLLRGNRLTRLP